MINLKNNPYGKYNGYEMEYILQMLDSENNCEKSWTQRFEEKFCEIMNVKYAISCNSGTSALHTAMIGAGIHHGDEVICPALSVMMDVYAIVHVGATPVFADVDPNTQLIDPVDVEKKITPKTKAIITVSLQGLPVDIDSINEIAKKNNLIVIDDSAQTMLGIYNGRISGTLTDIGIFSFENKKHMTCGSEGGMIVTNEPEIAKKMRKFAGIGYKHLTASEGRTSLAMATVQNPDYERFDSIGLNYRMNEISAAIGLAQLERIKFLVNRRIQVARFFRDAIKDCEWIVEQYIPKDVIHSHYTFSVQYFGNKYIGLSWKDFYNMYVENGGDGFYATCKIPYLEPVFKDWKINDNSYFKGLCPIAEEIQPRIMQFKTNYRNLDIAREKAEILHKLIKSF